MSFIQMDSSFSNVKEKQPVPKGTYDLLIENAVEHTSKESGKPSIKCTIAIEGHPEASKVTHYVPLPNDEDDAAKTANKMIMIKRFLVAFGIPFEDNGFNVEDFFGARGQAELQLTSPDEDPNGNIYNRLNLPRLADEDSSGAKAAKASKR